MVLHLFREPVGPRPQAPQNLWVPAFAGMTRPFSAYKSIVSDFRTNEQRERTPRVQGHNRVSRLWKSADAFFGLILADLGIDEQCWRTARV